MTDEANPSSLDRIERALSRIERAGVRQREAMTALATRHGALRARIGEALDALDALIEGED